ncbi:MAG TPA: MMPL family transporter [Solirubrobacteraceae bacterium]|nr:MMPL family transporter [Solirubrobacteraceae bacterium]
MLRLARWCTTHRLYVLLGWIALIVAVQALAGSAGTTYSNNFSLPGSDAQRATNLLQKSFPTQVGDRDTIVFRASSGAVTDAAVRARMTRTFAEVSRLPHVAGVFSPYASAAGRAISGDGRIAFATVLFDEKANTLPQAAVTRVIDVARRAQRPGLQVELGGAAIEISQKRGFGLSTAIGLLAAIVVLLITFGSFVAMGLPIATALFGLGTGIGAIALFTHVVDTPDFSSELAAMIGLGVGIDYALFIVTRFRESYADPGPSHGLVRESVIQAMDTAGRAVVFAGLTVVIALLGMMVLGVSFLYGVAIAASIAVLLVLLASLTLLPALLSLTGRWLVRPGRLARRRKRDAPVASRQTVWLRWSAFVQRRPWRIAILSTLLMLALAAPAVALRLGQSDASNDPSSYTTQRAYELLAQGFGRGFNGPLLIVAQLPQRGDPGALHKLGAAISGTPGVASVTPPRLNSAGDLATLSVYPSSSPQAYATTLLVQRLRDEVLPPIAARTHVRVYVGGFTAGSIDFASTLARKLPLFIGVVVLLSALLLMVVFRSLVIPVQAALMNLLSIGASLGVIVAIFQWGWFGQITGTGSGPIEAFVPVMLFAIVFGLSMDYEVFLVSRIHEQWTRHGDSHRAVGEGLALTGRVVTAAAAIMVCVFLSFMLFGLRVIEEFGLSLAAAVFLDAVVIRCLLLPAVLSILGERTWRIPAWLDRALPRLNIEGSSVRDHREEHVRAPRGQGPGPGRPAVPEVAAKGAEG